MGHPWGNSRKEMMREKNSDAYRGVSMLESYEWLSVSLQQNVLVLRYKKIGADKF